MRYLAPIYCAELAVEKAAGLVLRDADIEEIRASSRMNPEEALAFSLRTSSEAYLIMDDDTVIGACGVAPWENIHSPWMLAADALNEKPMVFLRTAKPLVNWWRDRYTNLANFVHSKNTVSIKWLKWLGFRVLEDAPVFIYDPNELFYYFYMQGETQCATPLHS